MQINPDFIPEQNDATSDSKAGTVYFWALQILNGTHDCNVREKYSKHKAGVLTHTKKKNQLNASQQFA